MTAYKLRANADHLEGPNGPVQGPKSEIGRGEKIRTSDPLHPMQVRYQAALRPDRARHSNRNAIEKELQRRPQAHS